MIELIDYWGAGQAILIIELIDSIYNNRYVFRSKQSIEVYLNTPSLKNEKGESWSWRDQRKEKTEEIGGRKNYISVLNINLLPALILSQQLAKG